MEISDTGLTNAYYEAKQKYRQDVLQFHPDKNPNGNYILFMNVKAKRYNIQKAYTVLGEVKEDGLHVKRHAYDTKCDGSKKIWRDESGFDRTSACDHDKWDNIYKKKK
eukprot:15329004-Ditylum_brightwellii.AAC.1